MYKKTALVNSKGFAHWVTHYKKDISYLIPIKEIVHINQFNTYIFYISDYLIVTFKEKNAFIKIHNVSEHCIVRIENEKKLTMLELISFESNSTGDKKLLITSKVLLKKREIHLFVHNSMKRVYLNQNIFLNKLCPD